MTGNDNPSPTRRKPHAQLHLPALSAQQALLLVNLLERAIQAIYRAHGDAMVQLSHADIDPPPQRTYHFSGSLPDDFPF